MQHVYAQTDSQSRPEHTAKLEAVMHWFALASLSPVAVLTSACLWGGAWAWLALAYVFVFPMVFCQWAYLKVVHLFPASSAAIGTLLVPVVGVYSSALILGEIVGWAELLSLVLTGADCL